MDQVYLDHGIDLDAINNSAVDSSLERIAEGPSSTHPGLMMTAEYRSTSHLIDDGKTAFGKKRSKNSVNTVPRRHENAASSMDTSLA